MNSTQTNIDHKIIFDALPSLFLILRPDAPDFTILDASDNYLKATLTKRSDIVGKGLFRVFPDNPSEHDATGSSNLRSSLMRVLEKKQADTMAIQKYDVPKPADQGGGFEEKFWNPKNTPVLNEKKEIIYIIHHVEDVTAIIQLENKRALAEKEAAKEISEKSMLIKENEERINLILDAMLRYTTMDFSERLNITDKGDELDAIVVGLNSVIDELENYMTLLKNSNTELEFINHELDSFSYSVSHDLRAPLRAIGGYSQVLLEDYGDKLDEEGKQNIDTIIRNAGRMGELIDDLLTFSRLGKQNLTQVPLDMSNMTRSIVNECMEQWGQKKAKINICPMENIEGDSAMLKQVMTNLVSNALKYSGKKEQPVIEIGSYKENGAVVYYIKDNGAGFDMKYYDKLFGVFQRLHSSAEFEGTGVGLALVQRIIKKHRGKVWAESKPAEGATFYFSLPLTNPSLKNN